jgi:hypothetical protein
MRAKARLTLDGLVGDTGGMSFRADSPGDSPLVTCCYAPGGANHLRRLRRANSAMTDSCSPM